MRFLPLVILALLALALLPVSTAGPIVDKTWCLPEGDAHPQHPTCVAHHDGFDDGYGPEQQFCGEVYGISLSCIDIADPGLTS